MKWLRRANYCERDPFPMLADRVVDGRKLCSGCAELERMEAEKIDRSGDFSLAE